MRAVRHPEDLGRLNLQLGGNAVTLPRPDRDGYPALGRDPPISEQRTQVGDRARPDGAASIRASSGIKFLQVNAGATASRRGCCRALATEPRLPGQDGSQVAR